MYVLGVIQCSIMVSSLIKEGTESSIAKHYPQARIFSRAIEHCENTYPMRILHIAFSFFDFFGSTKLQGAKTRQIAGKVTTFVLHGPASARIVKWRRDPKVFCRKASNTSLCSSAPQLISKVYKFGIYSDLPVRCYSRCTDGKSD